jgi:5-methylcytosine-specific restriction endonuclease McrBC GTP-binding regulatory subunit McrB
MSGTDQREIRWRAFRTRWPLSALHSLTLEQYTQPDERTGFSDWVQFKTDDLGWRQSGASNLSRIGIRALPAKLEAREKMISTHQGLPSSSVDADKGYCWLKTLGANVEEAFQAIKRRVIELAEAAQHGDLSALRMHTLRDDFEWKLFFLYQNPDQPVLLPAKHMGELWDWHRAHFREQVSGDGRSNLLSTIVVNQQLMAERRGLPLFDYVDQLVAEANQDDTATPCSNADAITDEDHTPKAIMSAQPLNQILYGPPGTGKTYATVDAALAVLDAHFLDQHRRDRAALKARFDALVHERRVRFVTFHQSFSYEDFVEGLRAHSQDGQLQYRVEAGVFRQLCEDARTPPGQRSLNELLDDLLEQMAEQNVAMHTPTGKAFSASYSPGNDTIACLPERSTTGKPLPANIDHIRAVLQGQTVARIYCESYVRGIADFVKRRHAEAGGTTARVSTDTLPCVLIIDEINRGNISRIFGELITLIEPSKRAGRDEALEVVLPYSKMPFSVPHNVYLIGTMNTADRSLTGMDVALRRRFVFKAMPPRADLLRGVEVDGIRVDELLSVMNQRIEALLDRDHCLGHAYFMPLRQTPTLDALAHIVRHQVLPLLQEYFFDDWQRIQWVLNDHRKAQAFQFVSARAVNVDALFGANVNVAHSAQAWSVNDDAFLLAESYLGVIDHREAQGDA